MTSFTWSSPDPHNPKLNGSRPLYGLALLLLGIAAICSNSTALFHELAALGSFTLAYYGGNSRRAARYITIVIALLMLVIAALIALYIGISVASSRIIDGQSGYYDMEG